MKSTVQSWRFLLVGDVGSASTFHLGDEAMLQANVERLKELYPGAEVTVASRDPTWTSQAYAVKAVPRLELSEILAGNEFPDAVTTELVSRTHDALGSTPNTLPAPVPEETVRALANSDGLMVSGGGNLNTTWLDQFYECIFMVQLAKHLGCHVIITGQTLGPHLGPRERNALRKALATARLVSLREPYSMRVALALGLAPERAVLHLDDAFFLPRGLRSTDDQGWFKGDNWIVVTVTQVSGSLDRLAGQFEQIARYTGCRLIFVPHVRGPGGDMEAANQIIELLDSAVSAEVVDVPPAEHGRWLVEHAAFVISMRYHPLVFAVAGKVPAIGIYVDEYTRVKLRGALGHAGLENCVVSLEMALGGALLDVVLSRWSHRAAIKEHLDSRVKVWRAMEDRYRDRLTQALTGGDPADTDSTPSYPAGGSCTSEIEFSPHCPHGDWSEYAIELEKRRDGWFCERIELLKSNDAAVEYAESLKAALAERDRELADLKAYVQPR